MESYIVEVNNTEYEVTIRENKDKEDLEQNEELKQQKSEEINNQTGEKEQKQKEVNETDTVSKKRTFNKSEGIEIKAPMTGKILSIKVAKGDIVEKNEVVMTLEAMKMETEIVSPQKGRVKEILTSEGSKCKQEDTLLIIEDGGK